MFLLEHRSEHLVTFLIHSRFYDLKHLFALTHPLLVLLQENKHKDIRILQLEGKQRAHNGTGLPGTPARGADHRPGNGTPGHKGTPGNKGTPGHKGTPGQRKPVVYDKPLVEKENTVPTESWPQPVHQGQPITRTDTRQIYFTNNVRDQTSSLYNGMQGHTKPRPPTMQGGKDTFSNVERTFSSILTAVIQSQNPFSVWNWLIPWLFACTTSGENIRKTC